MNREERIGRNEALFRELNEQIDSLNEAGAQATAIPAVCECGSSSCAEIVWVDRADYDAVRVHSERFLIKPGHQIEDVEDVVAEGTVFAVVAKKPGDPRRIAEETDPRR
jgi:hypothetical protein